MVQTLADAPSLIHRSAFAIAVVMSEAVVKDAFGSMLKTDIVDATTWVSSHRSRGMDRTTTQLSSWMVTFWYGSPAVVFQTCEVLVVLKWWLVFSNDTYGAKPHPRCTRFTVVANC